MVGAVMGRARGRIAIFSAILMATTAVGLVIPRPAAAQSGGTAQHSFDIPAQPLAQALMIFGQQSGLQVTAESPLTNGLRSSPVSGNLVPAEALSRLLTGTGLTFHFVGNSGVQLDRAPQTSSSAIQLGPVRVEGRSGVPVLPSQALIGNPSPVYAGGQVATGGQLGFLGNRSVMDTPFNVTSYTAKTIQDQQARTLADVLANDPSVLNTAPSGGGGGYIDTFTIRGFPLQNQDVSWNGLSGVLPAQLVSADFLERVEVLKGASGLLNGVSPLGAIGGAINVIAKHAADDPLTSITTSYSSDAQFGGHIDVGRRLGDNDQWGIRFNGTFRGGDTNVNGSSERLGAAMLGLDYRGDRLRLSLDAGYQDHLLDGYSDTIAPAATGFQIPPPPPAGRNLFPSWTRNHGYDLFGMARAEYDLTPNWTIFGAVGGRDNQIRNQGGLIELITDSAGDINNFGRANQSSDNTITGQAGVRGQFDTGAVHHQVAVFGSYLHDRIGFFQDIFVLPAGNIYDASAISAPNLSGYSYKSPLSGVRNLSSVALADTASILDGRVQLTFGGRQQNIEINNYNTTTGLLSTHYDKSVFSPAVGLVFKPVEMVSLYANYIEGLQQGPTAPTNAKNAGEIFPPYVSRQYEVGAKVDFGRVTSTLAAFQIAQPNGITDPATSVFSVAGQQRNRGVEWNIFGELTDNLRILGGASYIDGVQTETGNPQTSGKKATGVPETQITLGGEWDTPFVPGLTLTGRAVHVSSQYLDASNTQKIPDWTIFDLGARYLLHLPNSNPVTLRADVYNVGNKSYWSAYSFVNSLTQGSPRTFRLSATIDF